MGKSYKALFLRSNLQIWTKVKSSKIRQGKCCLCRVVQRFSTFCTVGPGEILFKIFGPAQIFFASFQLCKRPKASGNTQLTGDKDYLTQIVLKLLAVLVLLAKKFLQSNISGPVAIFSGPANGTGLGV